MSPAFQNASVAALTQMFEPIREDLREVDREFVRHVQSQVQLIPKMCNYIQDSGGKRIRPALLLMAARMSGYKGKGAVLYASVVEFIHIATLVHDDIIDESELRRGRQAVHSRWGNDITVLLGDFLYIKSMSLALTLDRLELIRVLCDVTLRMIEGELYQVTKNGSVDLTEDEHFDIIRRKTAYLFAGSAKIGGILGSTTQEQQDALWDYGLNIGMAFQIVDDLLDFTGEPGAFGKPIGGDLCAGKVTLPIINLMSKGDRHAESLVRRIVEEKTVALEEWRDLLSLLKSYDSIEYSYSIAADFVSRAKEALNCFSGSPEKDALEMLPDYVLSRDR